MSRSWISGSAGCGRKPMRPPGQDARYSYSAAVAGALLMASLVGGCSPVGLGVSLGAKLVGKAIDHVEGEQWKDELVGQPLAAADSKFGAQVNVYKDTQSGSRWAIYSAPTDPIHLHKIVVAVRQGRIANVTKVSKFGSPETSIPEALLYSSKAKGKSPTECEAALGLGTPLITARNERTGRLRQVYKAGLINIKGITSQHYCLLEFGPDDRCIRVDVVSEKASSRGE